MRTILALLVVTGLAAAAEPTPREQVLRLVPPDSALCFVVQNLRDTATTVAVSPFAEWASAMAGVAEDDSSEFKRYTRRGLDSDASSGTFSLAPALGGRRRYTPSFF